MFQEQRAQVLQILCGIQVSTVQTRTFKPQVRLGQAKQTSKLKVSDKVLDDVSPEEMAKHQEDDVSLSKIRQALDGNDPSSNYYRKRGLIYRKYTHPPSQGGKVVHQLVVPQKFRPSVLMVAHENCMSGHVGVMRMTSRVLSEFFWPSVQSGVKCYCQ